MKGQIRMLKKIIAVAMTILVMQGFSIKVEAKLIEEYDASANNIPKVSLAAKNTKPKTNLSHIKNKKNIYSEFDYCKAVLVSDEIYYIAYNYGGTSAQIVTLDGNGDVVYNGDLGYSANFYVTYIDERIYIIYNSFTKNNKKTGTYCKIFDMELNEVAGYDITAFSKDPQYVAVNKNGIIYKKSSKVYSVGFNGKNKKVILDLSTDCKGATSISSLAANNDYAAFTAQGSKWYYGVVDLKTNKAKIINDDKVFYPTVYGNYIMFPSWLGGNATVDTASGNVIVFNSGKFKTIKPKTQLESGQGYCVMTTSGKLITQEFSETKYGEENMCIRVYNEDGNCLKEIITEKGYYPAGNNEIIVYCFFDKNKKRGNDQKTFISKIIEY